MNRRQSELRQFLRRCFSSEEWQLLLEQPEFVKRLRSTDTFDDAEEVIDFAIQLLHPHSSQQEHMADSVTGST
jgi:hypothetical protein